jgi:penicillin amidase
MPGFYDTPDGPLAFAERAETIAVRGGAPKRIAVRETRHGPVISDVDRSFAGHVPAGHVVALSAMALRDDDLTPLAILRMNRAHDWSEFRDALHDFHAPQQNVTFADVDGNIAFYAPGRIPVRRSGDGSVPVPGWSGNHDWTGTIPFERLPQSFNPASGQIFNANHRIVPKDYPYLLTHDWAEPYRARRIAERLASAERFTPDAAAALQADVLSGSAADLVPVILGLVEARENREIRAVEMLARWDRKMSRGAPAPLLYAMWLAELNRGLYADELGPLFGAYYGMHPRVVLGMLTRRTAWCDDVTTERAESCSAVVSAALRRALDGLSRRYGNDMDAWRWGEAHPALFRHPVLGRVPVVRTFADIRIEADGGDDTVNRAQSSLGDRQEPFAAVHGPGFRAVYDLSDLAGSRFAVATGASGNPLSPRYANTTESWRDGRYIRFGRTRPEELAGARGVLRLTPLR